MPDSVIALVCVRVRGKLGSVSAMQSMQGPETVAGAAPAPCPLGGWRDKTPSSDGMAPWTPVVDFVERNACIKGEHGFQPTAE